MRASCLVVFAACGGKDASSPPDASRIDGAPDAPVGCARQPAAANRVRQVVVSHPYDSAGNPAPTFEVLELDGTGALTRPDRTFELGRTVVSSIVFTADGKVGVVPTENGKLGVFAVDDAGMPSVIDAGFAGSFYASRVVIDGDRVFVLDGNTRDNGGGIYLITLDCDGKPTDHGLIAAAKLPGGMAFTAGHAVIAAADFLDSAAGEDVHLATFDPATRTQSADAFADDMQIVGGTALSVDGKTFLIGDTSQFGSAPNRVAIVTVQGNNLMPAGTVDVEDPEAIVTSPFGNVAVVASAFGDALFVLDDGGTAGAWRVRGEVTYQGAAPMLPGDLAMIERGDLRGRVLVSENVSVRQLQFRADGSVEDLGSLAFGSGLQNIGGAIGVTP